MLDRIPLLSILVWSPFFGAALIGALLCSRKGSDALYRIIALCSAGLTLLATIVIFTKFDHLLIGGQWTESHEWIDALGITYSLSLDGVSVCFLGLTSLLFFGALFSDATNFSRSLSENWRGAYFVSLLVLETACLGSFAATDLFLFYFFFELTLIPVFALIGIWGGARRRWASYKFVLYTLAGSVIMFAGMMYLGIQHKRISSLSTSSFLLSDLLALRLSPLEQFWLFLAFSVAFLIKAPAFPFHSWLPDAYGEAPSGVAMVLSGVVSKLGLYGLIRFAIPLFPEGMYRFSFLLGVLGVIGILYGALIAWSQKDFVKMLAYSSFSHMGVCLLGVAVMSEVSVSGAVFLMIAHGFYSGGLFFFSGVLTRRFGSSRIEDMRNLSRSAPLMSVYFFLLLTGSIAVPLSSGFVGEFLILTSTFFQYPILGLLATCGVVMSAIYMLSSFITIVWRSSNIDDVRRGNSEELSRSRLVSDSMIVSTTSFLTVVLGIYPQLALKYVSPAAQSLLVSVGRQTPFVGDSLARARVKILDGFTSPFSRASSHLPSPFNKTSYAHSENLPSGE
jgi:NADH-quinone oxidoreductase subunit M